MCRLRDSGTVVHWSAEYPSAGRLTPDELFKTFERNKGRLQAVEHACFGLADTTGKEAACLTWIPDDVLTDLDRITDTLEGYSHS